MFSPNEKYIVTEKEFELSYFREYPDHFILNPPYQRYAKAWQLAMKEQFLDSLLRGYYIPKIVLRKVKIDKDTMLYEVIDGQQRISAILEFFNPKSALKIPESLKDLGEEISGKKYGELSPEKRNWIDKRVFLKADVIINIEDKNNFEHLKIAADLFYRLQQGAPLTKIESYHAKLGSNVRNFVSFYADDNSFDYEKYSPIKENKDRHLFFKKIIDISNDRMQHLLLLTRFLMIEFSDGCTDVGGPKMEDFFIKTYPLKSKKDFIDKDFLNRKEIKNCLNLLNTLNQIYKDSSMIDEKNGVKYLRKDYYILSLYILLRNLKKYYVFEENEYKIFDKFSKEFYIRIIKNDQSDPNEIEILRFRENRQQSKDNLEIRDRIIRKAFFEKNKLTVKDQKRLFSESDRIEIYTRDKGICNFCLDEYLSQGLPKEEAENRSKVSWSEYNADHIIPWIIGEKTLVDRGQVLCKRHNSSKGRR